MRTYFIAGRSKEFESISNRFALSDSESRSGELFAADKTTTSVSQHASFRKVWSFYPSIVKTASLAKPQTSCLVHPQFCPCLDNSYLITGAAFVALMEIKQEQVVNRTLQINYIFLLDD